MRGFLSEKRMKTAFIIAALALTVIQTYTTAAEHEQAQRLQNTLSWEATRRLAFKGGLQFRFRESLQDFYYFKWEAGCVMKATDWFELPASFRQVKRESETGWQEMELLLIDPKIRIFSLTSWQLELRTRFQFLLDNPAGFQFVRIQPKLWYYFTNRRNKPGWFIYNDFYFPFEKAARENNSRFNMFSTGLRWPLNPHTDLDLYYMLFSMRLIRSVPWRHTHQSCLAFSFHL